MFQSHSGRSVSAPSLPRSRRRVLLALAVAFAPVSLALVLPPLAVPVGVALSALAAVGLLVEKSSPAMTARDRTRARAAERTHVDVEMGGLPRVGRDR